MVIVCQPPNESDELLLSFCIPMNSSGCGSQGKLVKYRALALRYKCKAAGLLLFLKSLGWARGVLLIILFRNFFLIQIAELKSVKQSLICFTRSLHFHLQKYKHCVCVSLFQRWIPLPVLQLLALKRLTSLKSL